MTRLTTSVLALYLLVGCGGPAPENQGPGRDTRATPPLALTAATVTGFDSGLYVPIDEVVLFSADGVKGVANGNAAFTFVTPTLEGTLDAEGEKVDTFKGTIDLRGAVTLEVRVDAAGSFTQPIPLGVIPLPPFTVGGITVSPYAFGTVNVSGTAYGSSRVSLVAPFESNIGFLQAGEPVINAQSVRQFKPEIGAPDLAARLDVSIGVEVGVMLLLEIESVPIGGPALSTRLGVDVGVTASPLPAWQVDLSLEARGAWVFVPTVPFSSKRIGVERWSLASDPLDLGLPATRWSRTYDLLDSEGAGGLVRTGQGVVLMGNSRLGAWPWTAVLGESGVPIRQSSAVPPGGSMNVKSLVQANNGDLVATGWTGGGGGMRVERTTAAGEALWARTMVGPPSTLVAWNASVPSAAGGVILGGHITHVGSASPQRCMLAEIDPAGYLVWQTEIDLGAEPGGASIAALGLTSTGEILAAGTIGGDGLVLRSTAAGVPGSAFAVDGGYSDEVLNLAVLADDSYAIGGWSVPSGGDHWAWITSFEANDAFRWSARYGGENAASYAAVTGLAPLPRQGLLVTGTTGPLSPIEEGWLFRIDRAGMPIWWKSLRGPKDGSLGGVVRMADTGLLAFGATKSVNDVLPSPENDLWVVRSDVDGMVDFTPDSGMDAVNDPVGWKRTSIETRVLAPVQLPGALTASPAAFVLVPGNATTELLTP